MARTVIEDCDSLSPEKLEQARECFRLKLAGHTREQIGDKLGVSRSTVYRLLLDYSEAYRKKLETEPTINLIAERLAKYEQTAIDSLADCERATTDRARTQHRTTALKAMRAYDALALDVGIFPREPQRLYQVTQQMKPVSMERDERPRKTKEAIAAEIMALVERGRTIPLAESLEPPEHPR